MEFVLTLVGVVVALVAIMFVLHIRNIAGIRLKKPTIELRSDTELPDYLNELFKPAEAQLRTLGFERLQYLYRDSFISHDMSGKWSVLFGNKEESAYAEVTMTVVPAEMPGYEISFATIFTDDFLLQTLNCRKHALFVDIPKVIIIDPCVSGIAEQWRAHCEKSLELRQKKEAFPLWPFLFVARQQLSGEQMIETAFAKGLLRTTLDEKYAFRLLRAIPLAWKLMIGQRQMARIQQARKKQMVKLSEKVPVEVEVESFLRFESINRKKPMGRLGKTLVLLISVMLFSISFGITLSLRSVLFLLGAVMFHEMGHFLGMYFCGYRNLQVMFVPFLGAVAYGEEQNIQPFQRVIVLLLGPLPGIILGLAGLVLNASINAEWLNELTTLLLTLNLFNLLPVMPLDGGQLVQTVLFQRFPRIQTLFHIMSTIIFGILALVSDNTVLRTLCIIMCLSIPMQWRQGRALVRMKKGLAGQTGEKRRRLAHFFSVLRDKPFAAMPFIKKIMIVKTAERELTLATPSWKLIVATLFMYGLAVIAPLTIIFGVLPLWEKNASTVAANVSQLPDWDAKIKRAATIDERYSLLMKAGEWCTDREENDSAKSYYGKAYDLARSFGDKDIRVAKSCISLASVVDSSQAGPLLEQALHIQEQQLGSSHPDLAETLQLLANNRPANTAIPLLERRLVILEHTEKDKTSEVVIDVVHQLIILYDREHRDREAEQSVQRCQSLIRQYPENARLFQLNIDLAIYFAMHDRFDEAEKLLLEEIARTKTTETVPSGIIKEELGWILLAHGKGDEAIKTLREALAERRAEQKEFFSRKKVGMLNYLIFKVIGSKTRKWYSAETGESLRDIPLLLDLSAINLALGRDDESRSYLREAQQLDKTYGRGDGKIINSILTIDRQQVAESVDFMHIWEQKKKHAKEKVKAKLLENGNVGLDSAGNPSPGELQKPDSRS